MNTYVPEGAHGGRVMCSRSAATHAPTDPRHATRGLPLRAPNRGIRSEVSAVYAGGATRSFLFEMIEHDLEPQSLTRRARKRFNQLANFQCLVRRELARLGVGDKHSVAFDQLMSELLQSTFTEERAELNRERRSFG